MRSILVPTDFSENAKAATTYAVRLAEGIGAKIILLHVYHVPNPVANSEMVFITPHELEELNSKKLQKAVDEILYENPWLQLEKILCEGFATEEIVLMAKKKNVDLIIMGITGVGYFDQLIIGSNTVSVIQKVNIPVLTVPVNARYKALNKIVLAFDFQEIISKESFVKLKKVIASFNPHVYILNVVRGGKMIIGGDEAATGVMLENSLDGIAHSFHFLENENIEAGIVAFMKEKDADLLLMIPHKHSLLEKLFYYSHTKRMAFHTNSPMLTIHQ